MGAVRSGRGGAPGGGAGACGRSRLACGARTVSIPCPLVVNPVASFPTCRRTTWVTLHALFLASGVAGLSCQLCWIRMFGLGLGQEMPAVLAVVAAFFGGYSAGAWALDRPASSSPRPGRWYAALEALIGLWVAVTVSAVPMASDAALRWIGLDPAPLRQWGVAFLVPLLTLLPATAAMGATLPAMERFASQALAGWADSATTNRGWVGSLYAANTLGAVGGLVVVTLFVLPGLGYRKTLLAMAALDLIVAGAAWWTAHRTGGRPVPRPAHRGAGLPGLTRRRLATTLVLTGLLGIGFEVLGVRMLGQVFENTLYTYAAVLAMYLLGTATGAALETAVPLRGDVADRVTLLLAGLGLSCVVGAWALGLTPAAAETLRRVLGNGLPGVALAEFGASAMVFALPSLLMGATFSALATSARGRDAGVGWALGWNTLGGALAPAVFGLGSLPVAGPKVSWLLLAAGYLALVPRVMRAVWALGGLATAGALLLPSDLGLTSLEPGERLLVRRDGPSETVAVVETGQGHRTLRVNNRFTMGGTASANAERRQAHIPLLLHREPRRALFLGTATGITFGAAAVHPGLVADGVELVPEIAAVMPFFEPHNARSEWGTRLTVHTADARRFVRCQAASYDVIVADLFHPARDGAGALYTVEHYRALRGRLAPGGLVCQWLPLYQVDEPLLRLIVRTFLEVFPHSSAWLLRLSVDTPVVGLVGSPGALRYPPDWVEPRSGDARLAEHLKTLGLGNSLALFGLFLAGEPSLRAWAGGGPLNTDDHLRVLFEGPRATLAGRGRPARLLFELLERRMARPADLLVPGEAGTRAAERLDRYLAARDAYLNGAWADAEARTPAAIEAYLASARLSPDFTMGYSAAVTWAVQQSRTNPDAARRILEELAQAQPDRPVAGRLIRELFGEVKP